MIKDIAEIWTARRANLEAYGGGMSYKNVKEGFPKRIYPKEIEIEIMRRWWHVYGNRREIKYELTTAEQDEQICAKRMAL